MTGWLVSLRDRPIAESERDGALVAILALLIAATILLVLIRSPNGGTRRHAHSAHAAVASPVQSQAAPTDETQADTTLSGPVVRATRGFLAGYLDYLYGHAPASQIQDATPALVASLVASPPRVSPAMREHHAQIVELQAAPAPAAGLLGVRALVNDGGLVDYPIVLVLEDPSDGRLLVTGLEGEH